MYILIEERKKWCFMNIILLNFMIQFFLSLLLLHGWLRPGASNDISLEIKDQRTLLILAYKWIINIQQYSMRKTCQCTVLISKMKNRIHWCKWNVAIMNKYWIYKGFWIFQVTVTVMYWYKFFCHTSIWDKTINFPCVLN